MTKATFSLNEQQKDKLNIFLGDLDDILNEIYEQKDNRAYNKVATLRINVNELIKYFERKK